MATPKKARTPGRKRAATPPAPAEVDAYFAALPAPARKALEDLRRKVRAAAPEAVECVAWQMPAFRHHGLLVGMAAFRDHGSLFPMSGAWIAAHERELAAYSTSKGTIRFPFDRPLPAALVRKVVRDRMRENEAKSKR